jgi:ATP-binding cassette, subfamily C (CFTR/MRP), member 1
MVITTIVSITVRTLSISENSFNSVERVGEYCALSSEAAAVLEEPSDLPPRWPSEGQVVFSGVRMRYRPGLPLVLKGVSFRVMVRDRYGCYTSTAHKYCGEGSILQGHGT